VTHRGAAVHDDREGEAPAVDEAAPDPADDAGEDEQRRPAGARLPLLLGVAALVLALDQLTKAWAVSALADGHVIDLVGSLRLRLTMNYGSAFSIANGRGALISLLALAVVAVLLATGRHSRSPAMAVALGLVVGGAFGNLIDRAAREGDGFLGGGVVDFVDLQWWPVFNLADSAIVVGALLLFAVQWREADEPDAAPPSTDPG
jgi:signal peptidase II